MSKLFTPFALKGVVLRNRIAVSPMCQYVAEEGAPTDAHHVHYAALSRGGAGLTVIEATAVSPEGRITPGCLGLWNDRQAEVLSKTVAAISAAGAVPGIQIGHAGRKASANLPWEGDDHIAAGDPRGWETLAPSALPFGGALPKVPKAMTLEDIARVRADFVATAKRARDIGIRWLVLHFAHGYLAQNFLSPWSNQRTDEYGGSLENRRRFLLETLKAVREVWPEDRPLTMRLGVLEFDGNDEQTLSESIDSLKVFKEAGLDFVDVSIGFSTPTAKVPWGPAFMAPIAERVLRETGLPGSTTWYIGTPERAESLVSEGKVDLVMMGRPLLANPHWPYEAAQKLGVENPAWVLPASYAHWLQRYRQS